MHFNPGSALLAASALASASTAFLIPPEFPEHFKDTAIHGGPPQHMKDFFHNVLAQRTTTIELACPGCPFPLGQETGPDGEAVTIFAHNVDSAIHLDFDTHDHSLNINSQPLLPLDKAARTPFKAYLVRKNSGERSIDIPVNFALEVMAPIPSPHREGVSMIPVDLSILALDGLPVKVNSISLKLVQPPNHDFVLVRTELIPFEETPGAQECQESEAWIPCRWQAIIAAHVKSMMDMARTKSNEFHEWVKTKTPGCHGAGRKTNGRHPHPHPNDQAARHRGPHGGHRHHRHQRFGHIIHQTFRFLIIPALLGIIGGLTASAVGMIVGRALVYLYMRLYRRGQRGPLQQEQLIIVVEDDEKNGLLDEEDCLPAYEDSPAYSDVSNDNVESKTTHTAHGQ